MAMTEIKYNGKTYYWMRSYITESNLEEKERFLHSKGYNTQRVPITSNDGKHVLGWQLFVEGLKPWMQKDKTLSTFGGEDYKP